MKKRVCALVLAGGQGKRMNTELPKQFLSLCDKPVLYHSLKAFEDSSVDEVILVSREDDMEFCRRELVERYAFKKVKKIVPGGAQRYDSVQNGLLACEDCDIVLIHDGARPMIDSETIEKNIACAGEYAACVTAVRSKDTVKISDRDGFVKSTPKREDVWIIQTPQSFKYGLVKEAYERRAEADDDSVTDDAMVVEKYMNVKVRLLEGDYRNIKLTTPEDLTLLESMMAARDGTGRKG